MATHDKSKESHREQSKAQTKESSSFAPTGGLYDFSSFVQKKGLQSESSDSFEKQADHMGKNISHAIHQNNGSTNSKFNITTVGVQTIQKKSANTKSDSNTPPAATSSLGEPLNGHIKVSMEEQFGQDLSHVRIHTDDEADKLSQAINAKAFTQGDDIYFKKGEYQPGTPKGDELLAHEITHTIQQKGTQNGPIQRFKDTNSETSIVYKEETGIESVDYTYTMICNMIFSKGKVFDFITADSKEKRKEAGTIDLYAIKDKHLKIIIEDILVERPAQGNDPGMTSQDITEFRNTYPVFADFLDTAREYIINGKSFKTKERESTIKDSLVNQQVQNAFNQIALVLEEHGVWRTKSKRKNENKREKWLGTDTEQVGDEKIKTELIGPKAAAKAYPYLKIRNSDDPKGLSERALDKFIDHHFLIYTYLQMVVPKEFRETENYRHADGDVETFLGLIQNREVWKSTSSMDQLLDMLALAGLRENQQILEELKKQYTDFSTQQDAQTDDFSTTLKKHVESFEKKGFKVPGFEMNNYQEPTAYDPTKQKEYEGHTTTNLVKGARESKRSGRLREKERNIDPSKSKKKERLRSRADKKSSAAGAWAWSVGNAGKGIYMIGGMWYINPKSINLEDFDLDQMQNHMPGDIYGLDFDQTESPNMSTSALEYLKKTYKEEGKSEDQANAGIKSINKNNISLEIDEKAGFAEISIPDGHHSMMSLEQINMNLGTLNFHAGVTNLIDLDARLEWTGSSKEEQKELPQSNDTHINCGYLEMNDLMVVDTDLAFGIKKLIIEGFKFTYNRPIATPKEMRGVFGVISKITTLFPEVISVVLQQVNSTILGFTPNGENPIENAFNKLVSEQFSAGFAMHISFDDLNMEGLLMGGLGNINELQMGKTAIDVKEQYKANSIADTPISDHPQSIHAAAEDDPLAFQGESKLSTSISIQDKFIMKGAGFVLPNEEHKTNDPSKFMFHDISAEKEGSEVLSAYLRFEAPNKDSEESLSTTSLEKAMIFSELTSTNASITSVDQNNEATVIHNKEKPFSSAFVDAQFKGENRELLFFEADIKNITDLGNIISYESLNDLLKEKMQILPIDELQPVIGEIKNIYIKGHFELNEEADQVKNGLDFLKLHIDSFRIPEVTLYNTEVQFGFEDDHFTQKLQFMGTKENPLTKMTDIYVENTTINLKDTGSATYGIEKMEKAGFSSLSANEIIYTKIGDGTLHLNKLSAGATSVGLVSTDTGAVFELESQDINAAGSIDMLFGSDEKERSHVKGNFNLDGKEKETLQVKYNPATGDLVTKNIFFTSLDMQKMFFTSGDIYFKSFGGIQATGIKVDLATNVKGDKAFLLDELKKHGDTLPDSIDVHKQSTFSIPELSIQEIKAKGFYFSKGDVGVKLPYGKEGSLTGVNIKDINLDSAASTYYKKKSTAKIEELKSELEENEQLSPDQYYEVDEEKGSESRTTLQPGWMAKIASGEMPNGFEIFMGEELKVVFDELSTGYIAVQGLKNKNIAFDANDLIASGNILRTGESTDEETGVVTENKLDTDFYIDVIKVKGDVSPDGKSFNISEMNIPQLSVGDLEFHSESDAGSLDLQLADAGIYGMKGKLKLETEMVKEDEDSEAVPRQILTMESFVIDDIVAYDVRLIMKDYLTDKQQKDDKADGKYIDIQLAPSDTIVINQIKSDKIFKLDITDKLPKVTSGSISVGNGEELKALMMGESNILVSSVKKMFELDIRAITAAITSVTIKKSDWGDIAFELNKVDVKMMEELTFIFNKKDDSSEELNNILDLGLTTKKDNNLFESPKVTVELKENKEDGTIDKQITIDDPYLGDLNLSTNRPINIPGSNKEIDIHKMNIRGYAHGQVLIYDEHYYEDKENGEMEFYDATDIMASSVIDINDFDMTIKNPFLSEEKEDPTKPKLPEGFNPYDLTHYEKFKDELDEFDKLNDTWKQQKKKQDAKDKAKLLDGLSFLDRATGKLSVNAFGKDFELDILKTHDINPNASASIHEEDAGWVDLDSFIIPLLNEIQAKNNPADPYAKAEFLPFFDNNQRGIGVNLEILWVTLDKIDVDETINKIIKNAPKYITPNGIDWVRALYENLTRLPFQNLLTYSDDVSNEMFDNRYIRITDLVENFMDPKNYEPLLNIVEMIMDIKKDVDAVIHKLETAWKATHFDVVYIPVTPYILPTIEYDESIHQEMSKKDFLESKKNEQSVHAHVLSSFQYLADNRLPSIDLNAKVDMADIDPKDRGYLDFVSSEFTRDEDDVTLDLSISTKEFTADPMTDPFNNSSPAGTLTLDNLEFDSDKLYGRNPRDYYSVDPDTRFIQPTLHLNELSIPSFRFPIGDSDRSHFSGDKMTLLNVEIPMSTTKEEIQVTSTDGLSIEGLHISLEKDKKK